MHMMQGLAADIDADDADGDGEDMDMDDDHDTAGEDEDDDDEEGGSPPRTKFNLPEARIVALLEDLVQRGYLYGADD